MGALTKIIVYLMPNKSRIKHYRKMGAKIGTNCVIYRTTDFSTEPYFIEIGDNFKTSSYVKFVTHDGGVNVIRNLYKNYFDVDIYGKIKIGNNVFAGINSTILYNTEIGDNVIIAAGAICKGKYPSNCVIGGVPAKVICTLDEFNEKHKKWYVTGKNKEERKNNYLRMLEEYNNETRL